MPLHGQTLSDGMTMTMMMKGATLTLTYAVVLSFVPDILDGGGAEAVLQNIRKRKNQDIGHATVSQFQDWHVISVGALLQFLYHEGQAVLFTPHATPLQVTETCKVR